MAKKDLTEIVVILDRSGSMQAIRSDMEGGFNKFIEEQRKLPGECAVTLAQFDTEHDIVYSAKPLADVPPLSLIPRGFTALYDAVGRTVSTVGERLSKMADADRPERVIVVIITDGQENASKEFTQAQVFDMVKHQREKYSWEFVYIGANQDAFAVGQSVGANITSNYAANAAGTAGMFAGVSKGISSYRGGGGYN